MCVNDLNGVCDVYRCVRNADVYKVEYWMVVKKEDKKGTVRFDGCLYMCLREGVSRDLKKDSERENGNC